MNESTMESPWSRRSALPPISKRHFVVALMAVFCSAMGLSLFAYEQVAFFLLLLLFADAVLVVRAPSNVAILLVTALVASALTTSLSGAVIALSLILGIGNLAWLLTTLSSARRMVVLLPLLAAFAVAFCVTQRADTAFLTLAFLPAAIALAAATMLYQRRTAAICCTTGGLLLALGALLAVWLYRQCGSLALAEISAYVVQLREGLAEVILAVRDAWCALLSEHLPESGYTTEEISELIESLQSMLSQTMVHSMVSMLFGLLPAIAVTVCNIVAFEAQLSLNCLYHDCGWNQVLSLRALGFTMSLPAGILYVLGWIFMLVLDATTVFGAAVQNVCFILLPGFCVIGWGGILNRLRLADGGKKFLILLCMALLICCTGFSSLYLLALLGASGTIIQAFREHTSQKSDGQDSDHREYRDDDD